MLFVTQNAFETICSSTNVALHSLMQRAQHVLGLDAFILPSNTQDHRPQLAAVLCIAMLGGQLVYYTYAYFE